jgi:glycosyltransferase involved in cell wall biosynthesis
MTDTGNSAASSQNLKLLLFVSTFEVGGAERSLVALSNALYERGVCMTVVVLDATGPLRVELNNGINVVDLGTGRGRRSIGQFRAVLKKLKPDVVLSFLTVPNMISGLAGYLFPKRSPILIGSEHSYHSDITDRGNRSRIEFFIYGGLARLGYKRLDHLVAVSSGVQNRVVNNMLVAADKVSVIATPFSPPKDPVRQSARRYNIDSQKEARILAVGRLDPLKDYPTLLKAMRHLKDAELRFRLDVLGEGIERGALTDLVEQLDLQSEVVLHGNVNDPSPWYQMCDVFVLSSKREGSPLVLVEALYYGCQIVSTDCSSGPREILADGQFGSLVPVANDYALAQEIESVLRRTPNQEALRTRALEYESSVIAERYLNLIADLQTTKMT